MKVRLLRDARIKHSQGEIVEVSPAEYSFLLSVGSAEPLDEVIQEMPEQNRKPRKTKK